MKSIEKAIVDATRGISEIATLVLFGSRAGSSPRPDSDIDVAVLPSASSRTPRRRLQARVASTLADLAPQGRVDVVFLDEAPELLRHAIFERGKVLVQKDEKRYIEIRVATMREHGDREPYRRLLREAQARRLVSGTQTFGARRS